MILRHPAGGSVDFRGPIFLILAGNLLDRGGEHAQQTERQKTPTFRLSLIRYVKIKTMPCATDECSVGDPGQFRALLYRLRHGPDFFMHKGLIPFPLTSSLKATKGKFHYFHVGGSIPTVTNSLTISPAFDMAFSIVPMEWWEDGSTGFPPEAWEENPSHWDGQTACANCGFRLNMKVVAHYLFSRPWITPPLEQDVF